ncbi:alpha/beta hydrolase [Nonomuraea sp. NPDC048916]|uniref:alpha/beta hydrolase n=1 Tax=Nonomuraea sp. NPDC048916 TaxID=3154232 RepID=UPI00340F5990
MSEASEAFRRVALLAAEHHADLDAAARLMTAHAWVGGGAPHFAGTLATHRGSLQSALVLALSSLSQAVAREGLPAPAIPHLTTQVHQAAVAPATHGPFRGIDIRAMSDLVAILDAAADRLTTAGERLRAELAALTLPASPAWTVLRAAEWSATQSPDLRRRLAKIQRSHPWIPSGVAAYDLFGTHSMPCDTLLSRLVTGDQEALSRLLAIRDAALPARVNAWWHALAPDARLRLTTLPGFGSLNGLPAAVRDQANRHLLATEKARLTARLSTVYGPATFASIATDLRGLTAPRALLAHEEAVRLLASIAMIEHALSVAGTSGHPPAYLLSFDLTGTGRLVVSWGDPDAADITVTYVPGLNSRLSGFAGDIDRARLLWQQSQATAGTRTIASIAWLGYDPPQLAGTFTPGASVAGDAPASRGAVELAAFADGLTAARTSPGRHVVLGHSYGSLVTGKTAQLRPGKLADELIFVGSPGVGVDHATELGLPAGHVWVGEDRNDPVAMLGRFGRDPGSSSFGARHFPVGRSLLQNAHSSYWDPYSASLRNLGLITTQHYDALQSPGRPIQPQLLMPELAPDLSKSLKG